MIPASVAALRGCLGLDAPILGAPMARIAGAALATAVTEAGGLGFIGGGYGDLEWLDRQIAAVDPSTVGVGLITWRLQGQPTILDRLLRHRPRAVWLSYGDPTPYLDSIHAAGAVAVCQVLTLDDAINALEGGADVLVAQGSEAGGHGRQNRSLLTFLPAIVGLAGDVPVVAAGGIATGRQLAACWAVGAAGVALGTRLYATREADDSATAKEHLVRLRADDTIHSTVFDILRGPPWPSGYTGRSAVNRMTRRWHGREHALREELDAEQAHYREGVATDDVDIRVVWAGEGVDLIHEILPAPVVVQTIYRDALAFAQPPDGW